MPEVFDQHTQQPAKKKKKRNPETNDIVQEQYQDLPIASHRPVEDYSAVMKKEVACDNPYASFAPKPKHVHFESQEEREHILLLVRKHPITNVPWIFTAFILSFAPLFLQYFPLSSVIPDQFVFMGILGWYMLIMGYVLENFFSWFFNINILTDERVVDIDFYSLLYKRISTAQIDRVEDVTSSVAGFLGSVLNYGTVDIQTSAEAREFSFELIPQPEKVTKLMNELILEEEREKIEGRVR